MRTDKRLLTARAVGAEPALEAVGVSEAEERLYCALLDHPGAPLAALAEASGLPGRRTQSVLDALELKGLVTHTPDRQRRYFPTPPDIAVEALIRKREEALQRVRLSTARLQERARKALQRNDDLRVVEIVTGREATGQLFNQLQRSARDEVIAFDRPPYVWSPTTVTNDVQFEAMANKVRVRAIYDHSALAVTGAAERIRAYIEGGEEARVFAGVPLKLVAADRRMAMLPLDLKQPGGAVLLVRSSSLLDALYELFDATWARAAPISVSRQGEVQVGQAAPRLPAGAERLLPLLAAGLNDKTIAHQLGISQRTLGRRLDELTRSLNAQTRFQAGWLAALNALGGVPPATP